MKIALLICGSLRIIVGRLRNTLREYIVWYIMHFVYEIAKYLSQIR